MLRALYCRLVLAGLPMPRRRPVRAATLLLLLGLIGLPARLRALESSPPALVLPGFPIALSAGAPGRVYLATDQANGVLALDAAGPAILGGVALPGGAIGVIAADPATGLVYAADLGLPGLLVLDGANALLATIPLRQWPDGIAVDPATGRVYVAMRGHGSDHDLDVLVVLDGRSAAILAVLPMGQGPLRVALDAAAGRVYVADDASDTLAVLDRASLARLACLQLGRGPHELAVDARARRIYTSNSHDGTLTVVDAARAAVLATVPLGGSPGAIAADERRHRVYAAVGDGRVAVLDGRTGRLRAALPVGHEPAALAVDAATGRAFAVDEIDGSLWTIQFGRFGRSTARLIARAAAPRRIPPPDP